jgi:peptidoglycan/LPS O-acetylase OafA/YrhL
MKLILPNIKYLHIVRGLAALLVVVFHAKFIFWVGGTIYKQEMGLHSIADYFLFAIDMLSSCGKECVVVFFILSAFVIKHSFSGHHYTWTNFYTIRLIRIYWPFICSLVFSILMLVICIKYINPHIHAPGFREYNTRLVDAYDKLSIGQVIKTIFFIDKGEFAGFNYAYWSLGHELIFYLLFPLYNKLNKYKLFIAAAIFTTVFLVTGWEICYYQIFFVAGLLLYDYFFNHSHTPVIKNKMFYGVILAALFVAVNVSNKMVSEKCSDMVTLIFSFFIFDYVLYFIKRKNGLLMKLGDISYSLYLNHLPLLLLYYTLITLYTGKLVFYSRIPYYSGVIVAVLLTIPLYLIMEKPSVAYLKKLRKNKSS